MNNDSRCRYFHDILVNNSVVWSGYLLHEESWTIIKELSRQHKIVSFICYENKTSNVSDSYNGLNR